MVILKKNNLSVKMWMILIILTPLFFSCTSETNIKSSENNLVPDDLSISIDPTTPTTYDLNKISLDQLMTDLNRELFESKLDNNHSRTTTGTGDVEETSTTYVGYDMTINLQDNLVVVTPIEGTNPISPGSDDSVKCGGKKGDGWTSYGVCHSESCVKEKSAEAVSDLKSNLQSGKCMDIRVKRNTLSARVCARVVDC